MLVADAVIKRAQQVLLDYSREHVAMRYQIDGMWHSMPAKDRQSGDLMLAVLKKIASLNPAERRQRQNGKFKANFHKAKLECSLVTQGVQTGERVVLKFTDKKSRIPLDTLEDLGMREKMRDRFKEMIKGDGGKFVIISSLPGDGLTTSFRAALNAADRFMHDYVQIQSVDYDDDEVINVEPVTYDPRKGETPNSMIPDLLLKEPGVFVVPDLTDAATVDTLSDLAADNNMPIITRVNAREAVEALLRVMQYKGSREKFAKAVTGVLNHRLVRRLCDLCKQPYQPPPQLLQKLGIPPGRVQVLYREWQPPPPNPELKEQPEPQICRDCGGVGYLGRIAIFELLTVNDEMRAALVKQPQLEVLRAVAKKGGHRTLQEEGVLTVAMGTTSLVELQRVLKQ